MRSHAVTRLLLALAVLAGLGSVGCSKKLKNTVIPNQRPSVRLTYAPIDTTSEYFYVYRINWVGYDVDGRVASFEYALDPPTTSDSDTAWVTTAKNEQVIVFTATKPESLPTPGHPRTAQGQGYHVFVIRAVDNLGMRSAPISRAFFSFGVAPTVQITEPRPNNLLSPSVTPAVRIKWEGKDYIDPYGFVYDKPVKYKYHLYKSGPDIPWSKWLSEPDSLRRQVAPEFAGWDSTGPDSAEVQYTNLTPNSEYMFVVVAFGRSGAYSPIFDLNSNMLRMYVGFAGQLGPRITFYNSFFSYTYPSGGFPSPLDPAWAVQLQVPAAQKITFNWFADPPAGSIMKSYRWVLDLQNLDDETPRSNQNDWYHWSPWSTDLTTTIGPFTGAGGDTGEVHNFYLEAIDINGLESLGWIQFRVYKPTFTKDLLVVNDTRFNVDQIVSKTQPDTLRRPSGVWPTRAELDTFLFAVGGVRWKMAPAGKLSPPGLFRGYSFDTLGTRYGRENPTVDLGLIGQYRHVVWMVDGKAIEGFTENPQDMSKPMPTLVYMSMANRQNTLATWVSQGGQLWALGGGFGNATNSPWNNLSNDNNQIKTFSSVGSRPDLVAGRFMFDLSHWRSEFRVFTGVFVRVSRFDQKDPTGGSNPPPGSWPGGKWSNPNVNYKTLPTSLLFRTTTSDPLSNWPYRQASDYYVGNPSYTGVNIEFLTLENYILEMMPPNPSKPDSLVEASALDSIYLTYGTSYPGQMLQAGEGVNVIMTYYHGLENASLVFSGMSIWDFQKAHCQAVVDFVLQQLWHLSKSTTIVSSSASSPGLTRGAVLSAPSPARPPSGAARRPVGNSTSQRWR